MDYIPYAQQSLSSEDIQAAAQSLTSSFITRGPLVEEFENFCAQYCRAKYAMAFNSGTTALTAAYYAASLSKEDTLITSPNTFVGTLAGALQHTQNLKFVDIDPNTGCGDFKNLEPPMFGRLFLIPVHYSGIAQTLQKPFKDSVIIEDACEAFGALYKDGTPVGACKYSDMTVFSFHPAKTICTGEGGLVTTNNYSYYEKLKLYRNNGIIKETYSDPWVYEVHDLTTNAHFTEFQAALGLSQLKRIDSFLEKRKAHVQLYRQTLKHPAISFLDESFDLFSAHNLLPVFFDWEALHISRAEFMMHLKQEGIGTQVHFIPLYHHPYFKQHFSFRTSRYPHMEMFYRKELSLPLFPHLNIAQIQRICSTILNILNLQVYVR